MTGRRALLSAALIALACRSARARAAINNLSTLTAGAPGEWSAA